MSLQLPPYCWGFGCNICLLWPNIMDFTFLVQRYLIFTVFLLNIFDRRLVFGKFFLNILKNNCSTLVLTFKENGGLYHITFLRLFFFASLLLIFWSLDLIYENVSVKPLLFSASSFVSFALLNTLSSQEMSEICLFIDFGSSFKIYDEWRYMMVDGKVGKY